ncbi:type II toxin-antitoxin system RelE/ParE family toxin [Roseococcus sp. SDR]|uniref:type II toxin-antitoxin system RelE/ParE family toxin n=1 Tax=Roseococcus sp. SDR TaxID=2835532 RepID=UPI001BD0EC00|nr:type II toxin-antitoxin system RelE/ParE family toxin [Roseococcus sp. SDR]MBS7791557.1 type II toxin-antitoxin system RelE/ParE family toxin [Roseococcus sp. SDR]MBV1846871.1 type II toxin-antitoxin system RelE/ParE family toxin [Roseococcus sp. SDR]
MPAIEFTPEARADLLALYELIFREADAARAGAYLDRIERCCAALLLFPLAGRDRGEGVRSLGFERRASIIYRPDQDRILILRVLHAGRTH